jgi:hypothetical protein
MKRLRAWGPEILILLGGAVFALLGRGRWANVTEDHGFWFSAAQSMVSGGRAMHEVRLQWGPMPLWILEGVGRVFGMRVASFVVFQLVVGLLAILGVQIFARRFLSPVERWISAITLVVLIPGWSARAVCSILRSRCRRRSSRRHPSSRMSSLRRGRFLAASLRVFLAGVTFTQGGAAAAPASRR